MSENELHCCDDYRSAAELSRRRFLQGMTVAGAAATTTMFGDAVRQTAFASTTGGNVLVVISMRGGVDGLGMVVPHGDPGYYSSRPSIAVPRASLLFRDAMFGLHPGMKALEWLWNSGELAAVHAVGMKVPNRSHFLAMEEIEDADPGSRDRVGWVNRMIGLDTDDNPLEAVHLASPIVPTMLAGPRPSLASAKLERIALAGGSGSATAIMRQRRRTQLNTVWGEAEGDLGVAGRAALDVVNRIEPVLRSSTQPQNGAVYPTQVYVAGLSQSLRDTARLIRADIGTEVVSIDYGSWDMHSDYGTLDRGNMQKMVRGFAEALSAFLRDLGELRSRVTVVTISEFGRRVRENGNRGLDHGWGNMMLLAGAGVRGGRYYGSWPGLGSTKLVDGDLAVTTDYRNVLGEVTTRRFDRSVAQVFPGLKYTPLGVMS